VAQAVAHEAALAEERRIRQEETARQQAEVQQQMSQMYAYIQGLAVNIGPPLPPMMFTSVPAPAPATPLVSHLSTL
jgi:hypothetical protein